MARKPDTPCAGCGKLLYGGSGSKPAGERKCRECRKAEPAPREESNAKRPGRTGRPWRRLRDQVIAEETDCFRCGEPVDKSLPPCTRWSASVDHKVPLSEGGAPLDRENVALSHHGCNGSAGQAQRNGTAPTRNLAATGEVARRLGARGGRLWREMKGETLDPMRRLLLEEACRIADRLDRLDASLLGDTDAWLRFQVDESGTEVTVIVDKALSEARQQATALKQIVAELRQTIGADKPTTGGSVLDQLAAKRAARLANAAG